MSEKNPLKIQKNQILSILAIGGVFRDTFLFKSTRTDGHCCLNSLKYNSYYSITTVRELRQVKGPSSDRNNLVNLFPSC